MTNEEMLLKAIECGKLIDEKVYDETVKVIFEEIKKRAVAGHIHDADSITDGSTKSIPLKTKQAEWDKKVTTEQLNAAVNAFASGLAWKGVYTTLTELNKAIPTPKEGYFVIVTQESTYNNKNTMLIYEAEQVNKWQTIGEIFMPGKATQQADGLMSKEDKIKLDGLHNYEHPANHPASMITEDETHKFVTATEKNNIGVALSTANTAKQTAESALSKANTNEQSINTANGKITALEGKFVYLSVEEAQGIINKYKA